MESLIRHGDPNKLLQEESRFMSLRNTCIAAGMDGSMVEWFEEEVFLFLQRTASTLQSPSIDAEAALLQEFNDEGVQSQLIAYLKVRPLVHKIDHIVDKCRS